jgi:protein-tyrosine phosphatase
MIRNVLVVCIGNICRSPYGEYVLRDLAQKAKVDTRFSSAGLGALVGRPADPEVSSLALREGLDLSGHRARQFTRDLGATAELILVMEAKHRRDILAIAPELSGRTMLLDHWSGGNDIADPFKQSSDFHATIQRQIRKACEAWSGRILEKAAR